MVGTEGDRSPSDGEEDRVHLDLQPWDRHHKGELKNGRKYWKKEKGKESRMERVVESREVSVREEQREHKRV